MSAQATLHCGGSYHDVTRIVPIPDDLLYRVLPLVPRPYCSNTIPFHSSFWSSLSRLCVDESLRHRYNDFCACGKNLRDSGRYPWVWIDIF